MSRFERKGTLVKSKFFQFLLPTVLSTVANAVNLLLDYVYIRFCSTGLKGAALLKEAAVSASDNLNYIRTPNTKKERPQPLFLSIQDIFYI